jgi:hypothetical protein
MTAPWFDPESFAGWYALIVGGVFGTMAGVLAVVGGHLATQERARLPVLMGLGFFAVIGGLSVLLGVVALFAGQPYGIWLPPLLIGLALAVICGGLHFAMRRAYDEARERRVSNQAARQS